MNLHHGILCLFVFLIYGLFIEAVSGSVYIASDIVWLVNNKLEDICKEVVVAWGKSQYLTGGTEENCERPPTVQQLSGGDSECLPNTGRNITIWDKLSDTKHIQSFY
jgi:hypothetical protein